MTHYVVDRAAIHHAWDLELAPALTIQSGDSVDFSIPEIASEQIRFGASYKETAFDFDTIYNLSGPIDVEGAEPGDVVQIEILQLVPGSWGWTAIMPGIGLLTEDFPNGYVRTYELTDHTAIDFAAGISVPITPFLGVLGTHPGSPRRQLPFPPHRGGGNVDNRHLTVGTTVCLPVFVPGGRFSCGDAHAAQGDGEVCGSAVETFMDATLRFTLLKDVPPAIEYSVSPGAVSRKDDAGYFATMGIGPDLVGCAQVAVRTMVAKLSNDYDLTPEDAYVLCSIVGDLKIHEIVDAGMWNVGFTMPYSVFTGPCPREAR